MSPVYDNKAKNDARETVFGSLPRAPYQRLLTLPGREALDVQELLRIGAITSATEQTWVERDTEELLHMARSRDRFHSRNLVDGGKIDIVHTLVEEYVPVKNFDLVNLDLMSGITPAMGLWIETTLSRFLAPTATLMVTTTGWSRSPFYAWFHENAGRLYPNQMAEIIDHYDKRDSYAETTVMLLMSALVGFNFSQIPLLNYAGSGSKVPMTMLRLDNIIPAGPTEWPTFSNILARYEDEVPIINRQIIAEPLPDKREAFNRWLARSHMSLIRENGHDALYHYLGKVVRLRTFNDLTEAMRFFKQ